jgi:hypothetical protein
VFFNGYKRSTTQGLLSSMNEAVVEVPKVVASLSELTKKYAKVFVRSFVDFLQQTDMELWAVEIYCSRFSIKTADAAVPSFPVSIATKEGVASAIKGGEITLLDSSVIVYPGADITSFSTNDIWGFACSHFKSPKNISAFSDMVAGVELAERTIKDIQVGSFCAAPLPKRPVSKEGVEYLMALDSDMKLVVYPRLKDILSARNSLIQATILEPLLAYVSNKNGAGKEKFTTVLNRFKEDRKRIHFRLEHSVQAFESSYRLLLSKCYANDGGSKKMLTHTTHFFLQKTRTRFFCYFVVLTLGYLLFTTHCR